MIPDSMNPRQMAENILELQRQINEAGSELPTPGVGDTGKILKVGSDGYELATEYSYTPPAYSSTEEVNTGRKWTDGKDIYTRTYSGEFGELTSSGIVTLTACDTYVESFGYVSGSDTNKFAIGHYSSATNNSYIGVNTNGYIYIHVGTAFSGGSYLVTVKYTKTSVTPDVVPAPDNDTRSVEPIEEVTEEPVQETKTTRKRSTSSK